MCLLILALGSSLVWASPTDFIATDPAIGATVKTFDGQPPIYIYHWTSPETLLQIVKSGYKGGPWPGFKKIGGKLGQYFPQLKNSSGLFGWTNPETATRGGTDELYGEVLVRFKINQSAARTLFVQAKKMNERYQGPGFKGEIPASNYDLIFHASTMLEWVIMNPKVVDSFTADPEVLRPTLESALKNLKDPNYQFKDYHFDPLYTPWSPDKGPFEAGTSERNYPIYRIERYLEKGASVIPLEFLGKGASDFTSLQKNIKNFRVEEFKTFLQDTYAKSPVRSPTPIEVLELFGGRLAIDAIEHSKSENVRWDQNSYRSWLWEFQKSVQTQNHVNPEAVAKLDPEKLRQIFDQLLDFKKPIPTLTRSIAQVFKLDLSSGPPHVSPTFSAGSCKNLYSL